jgi:hypothetical protein
MKSHMCIVVNLYKHLYGQEILSSSGLLAIVKDESSNIPELRQFP